VTCAVTVVVTSAVTVAVTVVVTFVVTVARTTRSACPTAFPAQPGNADPARQAPGERPPQPSAAAEYDQAGDAVAMLSEEPTL
jgi:hypothetical protein